MKQQNDRVIINMIQLYFCKSIQFSMFQSTGAQGCLINIHVPSWSESAKRREPSGAQWQDQRQWSQTEMQEVPSEHKERVCQLWEWPTVAKIAQRDGGVSILANRRKLSGHGLGEQDLGFPAWAWVLDWVTSRGHSKLQPSCDSGILLLWSIVISVFHKAEPI